MWPEDKNDALELLARLTDRLPEPIHQRLCALADDLAAAAPFPHLGVFGEAHDCHGPALALAMALADPAAPVPLERHRQLLALLAGDRDQRRWAARTARDSPDASMVGVLACLARDDYPAVRGMAAAGLLRHIERRPADTLAHAALDDALRDPGTLVARALVHALYPGVDASVSAAGAGLLRRLRTDRSCHVRTNAERALTAAVDTPSDDTASAPDQTLRQGDRDVASNTATTPTPPASGPSAGHTGAAS